MKAPLAVIIATYVTLLFQGCADAFVVVNTRPMTAPFSSRPVLSSPFSFSSSSSSRSSSSTRLWAAKKINNWKLLPSRRVVGELDGVEVTTSALVNPEDAKKGAVVKTESGSAYQLNGEPRPGSKEFPKPATTTTTTAAEPVTKVTAAPAAAVTAAPKVTVPRSSSRKSGSSSSRGLVDNVVDFALVIAFGGLVLLQANVEAITEYAFPAYAFGIALGTAGLFTKAMSMD